LNVHLDIHTSRFWEDTFDELEIESNSVVGNRNCYDHGLDGERSDSISYHYNACPRTCRCSCCNNSNNRNSRTGGYSTRSACRAYLECGTHGHQRAD
jgi:hypothetical protein